MIKNIRGIEGDDIPYHLSLLGYDASTMITDRYYFFPLNDHYNTHGPTWLNDTTAIAKSKDVVVFYDLVNTSDYEHTRFKQFIWSFDHPCKAYLGTLCGIVSKPTIQSPFLHTNTCTIIVKANINLLD